MPLQHRHDYGGMAAKALPTKPWWLNEPERLRAEVDRMREAFPGFTLHSPRGTPTWLGTINTGRGRFVVVVEHYSDRSMLPRVEVLKPRRLERKEGRRYRPSEHLYIDGSVCYAERADWRPEDGHDATTVVAWVACWLASYTQWRMTGWWPYRGNAA